MNGQPLTPGCIPCITLTEACPLTSSVFSLRLRWLCCLLLISWSKLKVFGNRSFQFKVVWPRNGCCVTHRSRLGQHDESRAPWHWSCCLRHQPRHSAWVIKGNNLAGICLIQQLCNVLLLIKVIYILMYWWTLFIGAFQHCGGNATYPGAQSGHSRSLSAWGGCLALWSVSVTLQLLKLVSLSLELIIFFTSFFQFIFLQSERMHVLFRVCRGRGESSIFQCLGGCFVCWVSVNLVINTISQWILFHVICVLFFHLCLCSFLYLLDFGSSKNINVIYVCMMSFGVCFQKQHIYTPVDQLR